MLQQRTTASKVDSTIIISGLKSFDNDTVQYLNENFKKQKQFFVHKELTVLVDSLGIPIKSYLIGEKFNQPDSVSEITLVFTDMSRLILDRQHEKYKLMKIIWQRSISLDSTLKVLNRTKGIWDKEAYEFYKNCIIKDIIMVEK